MKLEEKLLKIQLKLDVKKNHIVKDKNGRILYSYRTAEDILEALKPLCEQERVSLRISDYAFQINDDTYFQATITLYDLDSNNNIVAQGLAREAKEDNRLSASQLSGSASSYARKYALNALFLLSDVPDADDLDSLNQEEQRTDYWSKVRKPTDAQEARLRKNGKRFIDVANWNGCTIKELDYKMVSDYISYIEED